MIGSVSTSDIKKAIEGYKLNLINNDVKDERPIKLGLDLQSENNGSKYPIYYNDQVMKLENPNTSYFKMDFTVTETQKVHVKVENKQQQFDVKSVEYDPREHQAHKNNSFYLDGTQFAKNVLDQIPVDPNDPSKKQSLNAAYCESSASDLRTTIDGNGKKIKPGDATYLSYELSANRNKECVEAVKKSFGVSNVEIISADGLSDDQIMEKQAQIFKSNQALPEAERKFPVFQKFKGQHGDGTSGYKSYYCASKSYVTKNPHVCPAEAIKNDPLMKAEIEQGWKGRGYSPQTQKNIMNKSFPPMLEAFLAKKRKENPNYEFDPVHLSPEDEAQLEAIYDSARYVKMKVYHSPTLKEPETEITYEQTVCSDALSISFREKSERSFTFNRNSFYQQKGRIRGVGLYPMEGGVSCPSW